MRQVLALEFQKQKLRRPQLSLRSWSRRLNVSVGALSEFISGKRGISVQRAKLLLKHTSIDPVQAAKIVGETLAKQPLHWQKYELLSNWEGLAVLNCLQLHNGLTASDLGEELSLPPRRVQGLLSLLKKLELVNCSHGIWIRTAAPMTTSEDVRNENIQSFHRSLLDKAERALIEIEPDLRDFSALILKVGAKNLPQLKKMIRDFYKKAEELLQDGEEDQVFAIAVQAFPLNRRRKK